MDEEVKELPVNLLQNLFDRRDRERAEWRSDRLRISADEAILEHNQNGTMRWYLHPEIPGAAVRSTVFFRIEIAPGESTGVQKTQGNMPGYVVQGSGHSTINGVNHYWGPGDMIGLPPLLHGLTVQHHNDSDEEALIVFAHPNLFDSFGVDMGCGFEQIENVKGWTDND